MHRRCQYLLLLVTPSVSIAYLWLLVTPSVSIAYLWFLVTPSVSIAYLWLLVTPSVSIAYLWPLSTTDISVAISSANKFTCSSQPSGLPAFMPCTTVVAYRVLQVFHYHTIYISLVDIVIIRDHQLIMQPLYSLNPPNRRPIPQLSILENIDE